MTILYFADTRFPIERANGVQTMATCHALAARGHRVMLVTRPDTAATPRDPFEYYDWPRLSNLEMASIHGAAQPQARRARFLLGALRRIGDTRPDVVYTRDLGLASFFLRWPAARRPPLVYESHGISAIVSEEMPALLGRPGAGPSRQKLRRLDSRERRVWRGADAYVAITRALADELTARYGARERVFVVPDGAKAGDAGTAGSPGPAASSGSTRALAAYAGHLYPWKGVDGFVRALSMTPLVDGAIVGGHPEEPDFARVTALVRELGLTARVRMTGLLPPPAVRAALSSASILVLPNTPSSMSERYTSPLKLFEYLALGRPIVASDLPALREVLTHGETALLVPPGDPRALADALTRLASDGALAGRLGRAARALAPMFTWDRRAERLEAALAAAVAS